jgi:hypothetical protein
MDTLTEIREHSQVLAFGRCHAVEANSEELLIELLSGELGRSLRDRRIDNAPPVPAEVFPRRD